MAIHEEKYITTTPIQQEVELSRFRVDTEEDFFRWFKETYCSLVVIKLGNTDICVRKRGEQYEIFAEEDEIQKAQCISKSLRGGLHTLEKEGVKILDNIQKLYIHPILTY